MKLLAVARGYGALAGFGLMAQGSACADPTANGANGLGGLSVTYTVPITRGDLASQKPATDSLTFYVAIQQRLHAFDLASGDLRWVSDSVGGRRLAAAGGRVFGARFDKAVGLDAIAGAELWTFTADSYIGFSESDADADAFYFGSEMHTVYAVRAADGQLIWSRDVGPDWEYGGIVRGVTVSGDTVYAVVEHGVAINNSRSKAEVFALNRHTGDVLWNFTYGDGTGVSMSQCAPRVHENLLLIQANWENTIVVIDRFTGTEVWRSVNPGGWSGPIEPPEVADGVAYSGSHDQHAEAFNVQTGQRLWRTLNPAYSGGIYRFAVCGSRLIMYDGGVTVFDRQSGAWLGRGFTQDDDTPHTDFVVVDNTAYFVTATNLVALRCPA